MPSLLVVVFVVELAVQLINTLGAATINAAVRKAQRRNNSLLDMTDDVSCSFGASSNPSRQSSPRISQSNGSFRRNISMYERS
jgi:hypothetical protein